MKKSEVKEAIKAHVKSLMEAGKEVVITTQDGTSKTASSAEKLRAKQASDNDDVVTYQKRGATVNENKNMNKEFLKMQKRAGLITESQFQSKTKVLTEIIINDDTFRWKKSPQNPNDMLMDYDENEEITKASFWETDMIGSPIDYNIPNYAQEENGKWRFQWDAGDIGGFVEGEDFNF